MDEHADGPHPVCRCGHVEAAHEHYRRGTDCGICGRDVCAAFRADPGRSAFEDDAPVDRAHSTSA